MRTLPRKGGLAPRKQAAPVSKRPASGQMRYFQTLDVDRMQIQIMRPGQMLAGQKQGSVGQADQTQTATSARMRVGLFGKKDLSLKQERQAQGLVREQLLVPYLGIGYPAYSLCTMQ
jgi:hypothetical protein